MEIQEEEKIRRCCLALLKITSRHRRVLGKHPVKGRKAEREVSAVLDDLLDIYNELR